MQLPILSAEPAADVSRPGIPGARAAEGGFGSLLQALVAGGGDDSGTGTSPLPADMPAADEGTSTEAEVSDTAAGLDIAAALVTVPDPAADAGAVPDPEATATPAAPEATATGGGGPLVEPGTPALGGPAVDPHGRPGPVPTLEGQPPSPEPAASATPATAATATAASATAATPTTATPATAATPVTPVVPATPATAAMPAPPAPAPPAAASAAAAVQADALADPAPTTARDLQGHVEGTSAVDAAGSRGTASTSGPTRAGELSQPSSSAVDRVLRAVEALESAPPPRVLRLEVDGMHLTVRLTGAEVDVDGAGLLPPQWRADIDRALQARGLALHHAASADSEAGAGGHGPEGRSDGQSDDTPRWGRPREAADGRPVTAPRRPAIPPRASARGLAL